MTKPELVTLGMITPIFIQEYERYLPTAFDESMSLLEKVNKVIQHLSETDRVTNDVVTQWNTAMEWVLNEGLNESVIAKILDMSTDGSLANLINETIFEQKPNIYMSAFEPLNVPSNSFWYEEK